MPAVDDHCILCVCTVDGVLVTRLNALTSRCASEVVRCRPFVTYSLGVYDERQARCYPSSVTFQVPPLTEQDVHNKTGTTCKRVTLPGVTLHALYMFRKSTQRMEFWVAKLSFCLDNIVVPEDDILVRFRSYVKAAKESKEPTREIMEEMFKFHEEIAACRVEIDRLERGIAKLQNILDGTDSELDSELEAETEIFA